jgi:hypothetical protein
MDGTNISTRSRVDVVLQLPRSATSRLQRELGAFARYCVTRIERELGAREHWQVTIAPTTGGVFASQVAVTDRGVETEQRGRGHDAALAIWDAMCRIEQILREQRVAVHP